MGPPYPYEAQAPPYPYEAQAPPYPDEEQTPKNCTDNCPRCYRQIFHKFRAISDYPHSNNHVLSIHITLLSPKIGVDSVLLFIVGLFDGGGVIHNLLKSG